MPDIQTELKTAIDNLGTATETFRGEIGTMREEVKKYGEATAETKTVVDRINEDLSNLEAKVDRLRGATKGGFGQDVDAKQAEGERKAFNGWARKGMEAVGAEERKFLARDDATQGGALAPTDMATEILKGVVLYSPLRNYARVRATNRKTLSIPKRTQLPVAQWQGEGPVAETQGSGYGMEEVSVWDLTSKTLISKENLDDSAFNLEGELVDDNILQSGVKENQGFWTGTGVMMPEGILTNASVEDISTTAGSGKFNAKDMIALVYGLKSAYAANGRIFLERKTMGVVRGLVDDNGQFLWQPGLAADKPNRILDLEYTETPELPAPATIAGGAYTVGQYPIVVADMRQGYSIIDRAMMEVSRDDKSLFPLVKFVFLRRVGGQVVLPEAIKRLKVAS